MNTSRRAHSPARITSAARPAAFLAAAGTALAILAAAVPCKAIPAFARQYKTACSTCHTHFPQLNELGRAFLLKGFRMPGQVKDFPLALKRNIPLGLELLGSARYEPKLQPKYSSQLDAIILQGGGLLSERDSFFLHHHLLEENRPGEIYEAWIQHAFGGKRNISLRAGQFEQALGLSPEILKLVHAGYAVYEQTVGLNDFAFSAPVRGLMLSGGSLGDGIRASLSVGALTKAEEAHGEHGEEHEGEEESAKLNSRFPNVFLRVEHQARGRRFGVFGNIGETTITMPDGRFTDHYRHIGIDAEVSLGRARAYGLWLTGEHDNPAGDGQRGSLNGGVVGLEVHFGPHGSGSHSALYAQYDRAHARGPHTAGLVAGPTVGVIAHFTEYWAAQLEYKNCQATGDSVVLATHVAF